MLPEKNLLSCECHITPSHHSQSIAICLTIIQLFATIANTVVYLIRQHFLAFGVLIYFEYLYLEWGRLCKFRLASHYMNTNAELIIVHRESAF